MKFIEIFSKFNIKFSRSARIVAGIFVGIIILFGLISLLIPNSDNNNDQIENTVEDKNTYLYEEVKYADEVYINCVGINAIENSDESYTLNLKVKIEQWNTDFNINQIEIKPEMFEIRLMDTNAPSQMSVFMSSLAKATVLTAASIAVGGEINVIEQTLDFATDYATSVIENAESKDTLKIKANNEDFEPFRPYMKNGIPTYVNLSFDITEEYLNSYKTIVLSIDTWYTWQQNIFLTLRPNTKDYSIEFDLNGGTSAVEIPIVDVESGNIVDFPNVDLYKEGYQFAYWTTEKDNKETKLRDLYFYTYENVQNFKVYAYYEELVPLEEYTSMGDIVEFKDSTYVISVQEVNTIENVTIIDSNGEEIIHTSNGENQFLAIKIMIVKTIDGNGHVLDNDNDFYLLNEYKDKDLGKYFGYINLFDNIKPLDDYNWIGLEIDAVGTYYITLHFEIPNHLSDKSLFVLEIDFFWNSYSKEILLK
ncbi:InlB B-repeat-containing protein [Mariniplasma anaerobium]|uniref:InlB B-repeat-containing protein n=1 Tax=Mariniplasma anaerobium TaxID=2735436 RepID=A0A7U9TJ82_9MOLU|nr:InlB B-repeat-containing protein [Mariniplasma anaerobium]BCR35180.1 hypothetical protein MPAN_000730 [Mariniplasma anaerobium]